jgi:type IV pilus assembly protein PilA
MTPAPAAPQKKMSVVVIVVIVLAVLGGCCGITGILAAIAIPNFIKYQSRAKQSEAKVTLKQLLTAERSVYAEKNVYSENAGEIAFSPLSTRYVCVLDASGAPVGSAPNAAELAAAARARVGSPLGVSGPCPKCEFTGACAGNIDNDPEIDVWSISTGVRTGAHGQTITAGTPYNDFSDLTDSPGD